MNILYLDDKRYTYNSEIHIDFISLLGKSHNLVGCGTHLDGKIKKVYNINSKIEKILYNEKIDIILSYNAASNNVSVCNWFSDKISKIDIPKFHISTDFCRNGYDKEQADWFENCNYTHSFFRHKESLKYDIGVNKSWLPFSFDSKKYNKNANKNIKSKIEKVGFVGAAHSSNKKLYEKRIKAIDLLSDESLIVQPKIGKNNIRPRIIGEEYVKFLSNNLFNLTCGGTCNFFVAKYIQIPAAFSALICTDTEGLGDFPKDTYIKYDENNLSQLVDNIKYFIKNKDDLVEKITLLNKHVNDNHNNKIRLQQLVDSMASYL